MLFSHVWLECGFISPMLIFILTLRTYLNDDEKLKDTVFVKTDKIHCACKKVSDH